VHRENTSNHQANSQPQFLGNDHSPQAWNLSSIDQTQPKPQNEDATDTRADKTFLRINEMKEIEKDDGVTELAFKVEFLDRTCEWINEADPYLEIHKAKVKRFVKMVNKVILFTRRSSSSELHYNTSHLAIHCYHKTWRTRYSKTPPSPSFNCKWVKS
jgi:hypothetical protein